MILENQFTKYIVIKLMQTKATDVHSQVFQHIVMNATSKNPRQRLVL
jgi:hypothetical protein